MEWFKHSTASHDDPDLSDAMDEFGHAGYSSFFILLELYGEEYHHLDSEGFLKLSLRFVARNLRLSSTKVPKLLNFYSERGRIIFKIEGNYVYLKSPKFDVIASNWVSRKKAKQDRVPTEGPTEGAIEGPTAIEVEEEVEVDKEETSFIPPNGGIVPGASEDVPGDEGKPDEKIPVCPHQDIVKLYHEMLPSLTAVKEWTAQRQDLLRTRWKEKPERQSLEYWRNFFGYVAESDFLMGKVKDFKADLEWLIRPKNFVKVIEGKFHQRNGHNPMMSKSSEGIMGWAARERARMAAKEREEGNRDN